MKALIAVHLAATGYEGMNEGIKSLAEKYLADGNLVFHLLYRHHPYDMGLEGVIMVQEPHTFYLIDQVIDTKEILKDNHIRDAEVCGLYRELCVSAICEQLEEEKLANRSDYINKKYETRIKGLDGYSVKVKVLEKLCVKRFADSDLVMTNI